MGSEGSEGSDFTLYSILKFFIFLVGGNQNAVFGDSAVQNYYLHYPLTCLERLLARRPQGIFINPFERSEIGPDLFAAACRMGLEGLVSKRRDRPYQAGQSKHWVNSPAHLPEHAKVSPSDT